MKISQMLKTLIILFTTFDINIPAFMAMFCRYGVPVMTIKMLMNPNIDLGNEVEMEAVNKTYHHS